MACMDWDIYGHEWAADMLCQHIANGKLRHAYLFSGPSGVGKRTLALRLAQAVNCEQPPVPGHACGHCLTCRQIFRMQNADLAVVKPEEAGILKVEQVRELQHFVSLAPYASNYRIALLTTFEQANTSSQNALLKTLEEPNPKVLILMTVDDAENLLPTIVSRCELLRLRPMGVAALANLLVVKKGLDKKEADLIAHLAGGRVGNAFRMIETSEVLEQRTSWMHDVVELIAGGKSDRISYSRKHTNSRYIQRENAKKQLSDAMPIWLSFWRDVMLTATGSETDVTNLDMKSVISKVAASIQPAQAQAAVRSLEKAYHRLQRANLQLMLDNVILSWPRVKGIELD